MTYILILISLLIAFAFSGCKKQKNEKEAKTLFVSIEPQKFFLDNIAGELFSVKAIIPNGSNPEVYDPTPSQMLEIGKSRLYFKVGLLGFENTTLNKILQNNKNLKIVNNSEFIPLSGEHQHDGDCSHGHDGPDPHVWSSPNTARMMAESMYKTMIAEDASNKPHYDIAFKNLEKIFAETDSVIRYYLADAPSCSFIIYHPALTYFAEEYGLKQHSIESNGKQPTPSDLKRLVDIARSENIKVVFVQAEFDKKNAETIAKEIGAKVVSINLLSYNWDEEMIKIAKALSGKNE
ncbi:hypothetical protein D0T56_09470 [Dysgonomonas sp. 520]|nr:hypothetical protein [Dysgonomonas sp. 520]